MSPRLRTRVARDFGAHAVAVIARLERIAFPLAGKQDAERLQAAVVLSARGDLAEFERAMELGARDWRDLLVAAGLARGDWAERLAAELGG